MVQRVHRHFPVPDEQGISHHGNREPLRPDQGMALISGCEGVEGVLIQRLGEEGEGDRDATRLMVTTTGLPQDKAVSFVLESGTTATLGPVENRPEPPSLPDCVWPIAPEGP